MDGKQLQVRMLGNFSLGLDSVEIDDSGNRSKKVWLLLGYMIYCRRRMVVQEELINLLWGDEGSDNPANALKTMFHRARSMLNQLQPSLGHTLIVRKGGSYAWNTEFPLCFDVEEFETACRQAAETVEEPVRLERYLRAVGLYRGDFLNKLSNESWVVPIAAYYHNLYVQAVQESLPLLERQHRQNEVAELCRRALEIEPYSEELYLHLMRAELELGDQRKAIAAYEEMSEIFFSNFGVMPSEEARALYREAISTVNERAVTLELIREQLKEPVPSSGALICDYDFFRVLYHAEARFIARSGDAIHIGLLSVTGEQGRPLSKRSLSRAMENLQEQVRIGLRKGDVAARCSVSQFILMLPQANYENSCMVCERIVKSFCRLYPHSPAELRFTVQPMEPNA